MRKSARRQSEGLHVVLVHLYGQSPVTQTGELSVSTCQSRVGGERFHGNTYFLLTVTMTECLTPSLKCPPSGFTTATVCVAPPTSPMTASTAPEARWMVRKC